MFILLHTETRAGEIEPRLVSIADIGLVRPAGRPDTLALTCVALKSNPDFPVWVTEDFDTVADMLKDLTEN